MLNIFKTDESVIRKLSDYEDGVWVQLIDPTGKELSQVAKQYDLEINDLAMALDEEESSRIKIGRAHV